MKKLLKILSYAIALVIVIVVAGLIYLKFMLPDVGPPPEMNVERTPERVQRGKYLATHVTLCIDCHSKRDWTRFSGPIIEGTFGMGGQVFPESFGFPGTYYSKNITPAGIGNWTDGELYRLITTGVNKEGKAMFPVMPYLYFGRMADEDIKSIIAYIRTLPPIENHVKESVSNFPFNFIINTIPVKAEPMPMPDLKDKIAYGKYLVNAGACMECHTQVEKGQIIKGKEYSGGRLFALPDGKTTSSANLTPDKETGIGNWTEEMFIDIFHSRSDSTILNTKLKPSDYNTIMPWTMYGSMKEEDLKAIFAYLKTLKPIKNKVQIFGETGKPSM